MNNNYIYIYSYLYYLSIYLSINIVHHVSKCFSCYKVIVVITVRALSFQDGIYITNVLLL